MLYKVLGCEMPAFPPLDLGGQEDEMSDGRSWEWLADLKGSLKGLESGPSKGLF